MTVLYYRPKTGFSGAIFPKVDRSGSGICCCMEYTAEFHLTHLTTMLSWNFPEVSDVGGARAKKKRLNFRYLAHSLQEKSYTANQCISPKGCFNPTDINNPQTGKPQTRKTGLRKFVPFILSDVQKIAEFNCEIIFQTRPQMAEISPENWIQWRIHYPGIQKARKCTITPVI